MYNTGGRERRHNTRESTRLQESTLIANHNHNKKKRKLLERPRSNYNGERDCLFGVGAGDGAGAGAGDRDVAGAFIMVISQSLAIIRGPSAWHPSKDVVRFLQRDGSPLPGRIFAGL